MKILTVKTENILRCKLAEVSFDGDVVVIGGMNAQGKSSFAKSIWMAFGGKDAIPDEPVTEGAEYGTIEVRLDEFVLVRRIYPDRKTVLELRGADGAKFASPQNLLNQFNVRFGFWPQEFLALKQKDQVEILKKVTGLDFSTLEEERTQVYAKRTEVNRELDAVSGALKTTTVPPLNVPDELVSASDLVGKLEKAKASNQQKESLLNASVQQNEKAIAIRQKIEALKVEYEACVQLSEQLQTESELLTAIDLAPIQEEINNLEVINEAIRTKKKTEELFNNQTRLKAHSEQLTSRLQGIDEEKRNAINKAQLPIPGLSFDDERGVLYNDKPLAQASSAQQWEVAIAIGFALNPKLKLIYVEYASLLDVNTLNRLCQLVHGLGGQLILEIVGESVHGEAPTILFEDGYGKTAIN